MHTKELVVHADKLDFDLSRLYRFKRSFVYFITKWVTKVNSKHLFLTAKCVLCTHITKTGAYDTFFDDLHPNMWYCSLPCSSMSWTQSANFACSIILSEQHNSRVWGFFGGHIRALLDFLPHTTISRTLLMYLSFSQTAGIGEPRMPIHVYNLDGPFNRNKYEAEAQ